MASTVIQEIHRTNLEWGLGQNCTTPLHRQDCEGHAVLIPSYDGPKDEGHGYPCFPPVVKLSYQALDGRTVTP